MHLSTTVPLAKLAIDEVANVRKTGRGSEPAFTASIRFKGIIEPLTVRKNGRGYRVVNGGKRLEALQWMEAHGESAAGVLVDRNYEVPVTIRDEDDREARDTSLTANIVHAPMHPVDEFEAFAALSAEGMQTADIAARYALTEKQVDQRLALGKLSPKIRDAWRAGEIGAKQAEAFTLAPTIKDQDRVFDKLKKSGELRWGDHVIRQAFVGKQGDVGRLVAFVGEEATRAAGIDLRKDLFGTSDTVPDPVALKKLADDKLTSTCAELTAAGWSWASPKDELPDGAAYSWATIPATKAKATKAEAKRLQELRALVDTENLEADAGEAAEAELEAIESAIAARAYSADDMARAGCIVTIGHRGELEIRYGVLKPAEAKKEKARERAKEKAKAGGAKGDVVEAGPEISNALAHDLSVKMSLAAREALQAERQVALAALLAGFLSAEPYGDPVRVRHEGLGHAAAFRKERYAAAFARFKAMTVDELLAVAAGVAGEAVSLERHTAEQLPMANVGVAVLLNAIDPGRLNECLKAQFDPTDFFTRASAKVATGALTEIDGERTGLPKKKPDLAALAAQRAREMGWLPPGMRTGHYAGPGPAWAPPEAKPEPKAKGKGAAKPKGKAGRG